MPTTSLLYVSRSCLHFPEQAPEVTAIFAVSRSRNDAAGVTGAIIFTETHFAQVLEGEASAVENIMARIRRDPRHEVIREVRVASIEQRLFEGWRMAYSGPSLYVDRLIRALIFGGGIGGEGDRERCAERLIEVMRELASSHDEAAIEAAASPLDQAP